MDKNMQISKLLIPKFVVENNCNIQSVFDLLRHYDENIQDQTAVMTNDNHVSVQQLNYHTGCDGYGSDGDDDPYPLSTDDLRNNDKKILSLLNEEMWSTYSFKALERKLDIHQQSLARALKRLVDLDLIERTPAGYKLIKKNIFLSNTIPENTQLSEEQKEEPEMFEAGKSRKRFNQLIQVCIPIRNNTELVASQLVGKWFGSLRWFGLIKKETGLTLQWVAINKYNSNKLFQVNVNIVSEYIVIESNAVSDKEKIEAMSSSNRIVSEITKILQRNPQQECEIPDEFTMPTGHVPTYTSKVKQRFKRK